MSTFKHHDLLVFYKSIVYPTEPGVEVISIEGHHDRNTAIVGMTRELDGWKARAMRGTVAVALRTRSYL